nr:MAG TPA: hypothetical protein [Caudoviricetes sp.]
MQIICTFAPLITKKQINNEEDNSFISSYFCDGSLWQK